MKRNDFLKALAVVVGVTVTCGAHAQASSSEASGSMSASMSRPMSKKEMKLAERRLNKAVLKAISKALPGVDVTTVYVHSQGGAVTLTGSVPQQSQIEAAGNAAKAVHGVTSVSNKLIVVGRSQGAG